VPLNSPDPLDSIARLARSVGDRLLVGAGTVTSAAEVDAVQQAGGRIIVSPHFDPAVVQRTLDHGLEPLPGAFTPSEIFAAWRLGVRAVKLFPAELAGPVGVKALRSILPRALRLLPVGGITPDNLAAYADAGADGFGIGSALYKPGDGPAPVRVQADRFVEAARAIRFRTPDSPLSDGPVAGPRASPE
jgi:2-dehydro-3-deoxyphosphogalactonate aldolase